MKTKKKKVDFIAKGPKILIFDLETSPITAYQWSLFQQYTTIDMVKGDSYLMCWAAKWLGEKEVFSEKLPDYKTLYKKNREDDSKLVKPLWDLMNEADMVIAHNARKFDVPKINARFLYHDMLPPDPYKIIDTLSIARREFRLTSNKLDWLGEYLNLGKKHKTDFDLWVGCMTGKKEAWDYMQSYNIQDVNLLEKVYLKLRAWDKRHPNIGLYIDDNKPRCTACGSDKIIKKGHEFTQVGMYQRWRCNSCGHPNRGRYTELPKEKRKTLLTNAV